MFGRSPRLRQARTGLHGSGPLIPRSFLSTWSIGLCLAFLTLATSCLILSWDLDLSQSPAPIKAGRLLALRSNPNTAKSRHDESSGFCLTSDRGFLTNQQDRRWTLPRRTGSFGRYGSVLLA